MPNILKSTSGKRDADVHAEEKQDNIVKSEKEISHAQR